MALWRSYPRSVFILALYNRVPKNIRISKKVATSFFLKRLTTTPLFSAVYIVERLILQTIYVLNKEILQFWGLQKRVKMLLPQTSGLIIQFSSMYSNQSNDDPVWPNFSIAKLASSYLHILPHTRLVAGNNRSKKWRDWLLKNYRSITKLNLKAKTHLMTPKQKLFYCWHLFIKIGY